MLDDYLRPDRVSGLKESPLSKLFGEYVVIPKPEFSAAVENAPVIRDCKVYVRKVMTGATCFGGGDTFEQAVADCKEAEARLPSISEFFTDPDQPRRML